MKFTAIGLLILASLALLVSCTSESDSVMRAKKLTDTKRDAETKLDSDFLIEMADARMMDFQEGKLAAQRGTTQEIQDYGRKMMTDQKQLLAEIRTVAREERIILPDTISDSKQDGLKDLEKKDGKDFDKTFVSMITIDHKRDVKEFDKAATASDVYSPVIKTFALKSAPLIHSHLNEIEGIRERM